MDLMIHASRYYVDTRRDEAFAVVRTDYRARVAPLSHPTSVTNEVRDGSPSFQLCDGNSCRQLGHQVAV